jgi:tRNA pseudouridine32 synthase
MLQKDAIECGKVVVNGQKAESTAHIVKNGDIISHTLHRHEPPVSARPIGIVHEDDDMIVINKPAGIPVHPAGRYNYNSVVELMRAERGCQWNPLPCNRLDRLTSGVMFIGKHPKAAEKLSIQIADRGVKKEYIARVVGEFPAEDTLCDQPILAVSPKLGLNRARASGKTARTLFKRLAYYPPTPSSSPPGERGDGRDEAEKAKDEGRPWRAKRGYSIVRCMPLTGRTHQIRVHLQFLGHPIANDPIYANQRVFGLNLGAFDASPASDASIIEKLSLMGKSEIADAMAYHDEMMEEYNRAKAEKMTGELCEVCQTPLYSDPGPHELGIYLHAVRYSCMDGGWSYETDLPAWALPPDGSKGAWEESRKTDLAELAEKVEGLDVDGGGVGEVVTDGASNVHIVPSTLPEATPG